MDRQQISQSSNKTIALNGPCAITWIIIIMSYLTTAALRLDGAQFIPWLKNCLDQLSLNSTADPYLLLPKPRDPDTPIIH